MRNPFKKLSAALKTMTTEQKLQEHIRKARNNIGIPAPKEGTIRITTLADLMELDAKSFMAIAPHMVSWMRDVHAHKEKYEKLLEITGDQIFTHQLCSEPFAAIDWTLKEQQETLASLDAFNNKNVTSLADYLDKSHTKH